MDINNQSQNFGNFRANQKTIVKDGYDLNIEKEEIAEITNEIKEELLKKWHKVYANAQIFSETVSAIHPEARDFLLEFARVNDYDEIAKQTGLDGKGRDALGHVVWKIVQTKNWNGLQEEVRSQIGQISSAGFVAQLLEQKVIGKARVLSEKPVVAKKQNEVSAVKEIKLSLSQAMAQYPNLGEQAITVNPLKLRYFPTPVKASIKNWITDYHDCLGGGKHGTIDRGNYLFHSENGKKLTPIERQKVSNLLKSLDEETLLSIDGQAQKIVFNLSAVEIPKRENASSAGDVLRESVERKEIPHAENFSNVEVSRNENTEKVKKTENDSQDDVMISRIKQSLNFAERLPLKNEKNQDNSGVFAFEDSDYANALREKININSKPRMENPGSEKENMKKQETPESFTFSFPQKLPVEKSATKFNRISSAPIRQEEDQFGKSARVWNSPDFKRQIKQEQSVEARKIESAVVEPEQDIKNGQNQASRVNRAYSPYIITPSDEYEKDSAVADNLVKNEPKIQGNTVDLS